jgi:hypothetical protein
MRIALLAISALALGGCASHPSTVSSRQQLHRNYAPAPAAALCFDPPALAGKPRLDLSRDERRNSAFIGFTDTTTTVYSVNVDDWYADTNASQSNPVRDQFARHSVSETLAVTHR